MAWIYLFIAGIFEIGWPLGFKLAQTPASTAVWITFSIISMSLSGLFLYLAQRTIPIGIAYATWTGVGAVGTFLLGVIVFQDKSALLSWVGLALIISGISLLKISHLTA